LTPESFLSKFATPTDFKLSRALLTRGFLMAAETLNIPFCLYEGNLDPSAVNQFFSRKAKVIGGGISFIMFYSGKNEIDFDVFE
jgi:hypothetical protein